MYYSSYVLLYAAQMCRPSAGAGAVQHRPWAAIDPAMCWLTGAWGMETTGDRRECASSCEHVRETCLRSSRGRCDSIGWQRKQDLHLQTQAALMSMTRVMWACA